MKKLELRSVEIHSSNNVTSVEGVTLSGDLIEAASRAAFVAGASEVAQMFRERIEANDMPGLIELSHATKTNSFYGISN